ncbi:alpha/beta hydrolase [Dactylosporangium siamense]|uniref:Acetylhydrolase n=1 Tax=Dactylosporangium siamense TaxID=685454 RepID=A0A919PEW9_9ACTN|nr:alpha/beta hydrolase [Dactylosporangium siamense]GIG42922.1 acetylhydrolase [Dactylosporangium siamense]
MADVFADQAVAAMVAASREPQLAVSVAELRRGGKARAALRPPGPAMPVEDRTVGGVGVRVYHQSGDAVIVFAHGGGFVLGDLETHDAFVRRLAHATGRTVVAVDYRRAPEDPFPAAVDDVLTVLDAQTAARVAVAGDSAGGFLVVQAALVRRERIDAQLLVCPLIDVTLPAATQPSVAEKGTGYTLDVAQLREWIGWWAPEKAPDPLAEDLTGMPPALVAVAEHDPLRDGGSQYAQRLTAAGVPVVHRTAVGHVHNFAQSVHVSTACAEVDAQWLRDAAQLLSGSG